MTEQTLDEQIKELRKIAKDAEASGDVPGIIEALDKTISARSRYGPSKKKKGIAAQW